MDGWADYEGEVIRSEDIYLEQVCPEEIVAPNQVCNRRGGATETTVYAIQRIPRRVRT